MNAGMTDILNALEVAKPYLIGIGFAIIVAVVLLIWIKKSKYGKEKKKFLRRETLFSSLGIIILLVNSILFIPLQTVLTSYFLPSVTMSENVKKMGEELGEEIAADGSVLLKNDGDTLPLKDENPKVNVFGWSSTNPIYGGTGSGAVDTTQAITLLDGLKNAGIEYNEDLVKFYQDFRTDRPLIEIRAQDWTVPEPTIDEYDDADIFESAKEYSNTAVVVLSRSGGEGADIATSIEGSTGIEMQTLADGRERSVGLISSEYDDDIDAEKHYLELSNREKAMLERVKSEFENIIVVVNASNTMELGFVEDQAIDSVLWIGAPGQTGFNALGKILTGEINPSGKTVDTYLYDLKADPTYNNIGKHHYTGTDDLFQTGLDPSLRDGYQFVDYREGIYLGYRFFETYYMNDEDGYKNVVQYPFGYGLSYTDFTQEINNFTVDNEIINVDVTVTNVGKVAGKDIVQLYNTAPYLEGGIEKSHVELIAFDKTDNLEPGASETFKFEIPIENLASYDYKNAKSYVVESGKYEIKLMEDAHTLIDSKTFNIDQTITYNESNKRRTDKKVATNQFEHAEGDLEYLSRANNFENYERVMVPATDRELSKEIIEVAANKPEINDNDVAPILGAKNGLNLSDVVGLDYDDSKWDELVDQLTVDDMQGLISLGGYQTGKISSIGKPATVDVDGPAGLSSFVGSGIKGSASPVAVVISSSWNTDLALQRGALLGYEALELGVNGWYGPGMNLHRGAFGGRNFEYYSEDALVSARFAEAEVKGAEDKGLYAYIKHLALNEQESNRNSRIMVWANEQSIRELYLKPFEYSVKSGTASAAMSSYTYIGSRWAGADSNLLENVLREEWGFRGMVLTDYFGNYDYMDADAAIANGNDIMLSTLGGFGATVTETDKATVQINMKRASKNILYTVANSNAMYSADQKEEILREVGGRVSTGGLIHETAKQLGLQGWMLVAILIDIVLFGILGFFSYKSYKHYKKTA